MVALSGDAFFYGGVGVFAVGLAVAVDPGCYEVLGGGGLLGHQRFSFGGVFSFFWFFFGGGFWGGFGFFGVNIITLSIRRVGRLNFTFPREVEFHLPGRLNFTFRVRVYLRVC